MPSTGLALIIDGIVAIVLIGAVTTLLALHDLTESTAIALYGVSITLVGGSAKAILALKVPPPDPPQE